MAKAVPGVSEKEVLKMYGGGHVSADFVFRYLQAGGRPALAQAMRSMRRATIWAAVSLFLMVATVSVFVTCLTFRMAAFLTTFSMLSTTYVLGSSLTERRRRIQEIRAELARDIMET